MMLGLENGLAKAAGFWPAVKIRASGAKVADAAAAVFKNSLLFILAFISMSPLSSIDAINNGLAAPGPR